MTAGTQAAGLSTIDLQRSESETGFIGSQVFFAQREADSLPPVTASSPAEVPQSASSPAHAPASAAQPAGEEAMDALAGKLYDRIRSRLKSELLVDRERAGLLTDLR